MKRVIEVEDDQAAVLRETGSGGLVGRGLLAEGSLADRLEPAETPRFVVRNRKRGVTVERADDGETAVAELTPDGNHSGAALVTDRRVLFAVGRADGDRTRSVPLSSVVDVRTETGLLGGAFVLDTVDGRRYRFPTRGDLAAVREFVDAAAGVWTRAERHLDAAGEALDRADAAVESGDADAAFSAVDDARETLTEAREATSSLEGGPTPLSERTADARDRLSRCERRATVERADAARERGQTAWDEGEYEAAFDQFDRAEEGYAAALAVDADDPTDETVERRREAVATEREALSTEPLARAERAAEKAGSAANPEAAVEWWERALDRYETLLSLDWGRDERRFAGERDAVRERLETVAERLVEARCDRARGAIEAAAKAPPASTAAATERAETALDCAHELARERVPGALERVERLRGRLAERRATPAGADGDESADGDTVAVQAAFVGAPALPDVDDGETARSPDGAPSEDATAAAADGAGESSGEGWVFADDPADEWMSPERATATDADSASDDDESTVETDDGGVAAQTDGEESTVEAADGGADDSATDLTAVESDQFRALVATLFEATGWETTPVREAPLAVGLRVTAPGPAAVTAGVVTVHAARARSVDAADVEQFATAGRDADVDAVVVVTGARLSDPARERAAASGAHLVGPDELAAELDRLGVSWSESGPTES